jgi:pyridoxamine 5'-phosphate oxidase
MMSTSGQTPGDLARIRQEYERSVLLEPDLAPDWHAQFGQWLSDAIAAALPEPNAMVVATADARGRPSARTVLLKGFDQRGFTFFTNYRSRKGVEAAENPYASLVFAWLPLHRQVVVCGTVSRVPRSETEAYFAVRPRESQLGAWASAQSSVLPDRSALDRAYAEAQRRFPQEVPAPAHWGGLRVAPESVEFWQGRPSRLHDRLRYRKVGDAWIIERLAP